ncbi:hypothetical protein ACFW04_008280 [Cataglyphis niger]
MRAGCHIKLPREIMMKRAVINMQSRDNACFAWSLIAVLYPTERNADRKSSYPHYTTILNLQDIEFPMTMNQIKKIREKNIVPLCLNDFKRYKHINLLYVENNNIGHFAWIKNLFRLVSSQLSEKDHRKYICDWYVYFIYYKLQSHTVDCREVNDCAIKLPSDKDKWLTFNNYNRKKRLPFVVYADLECVLEKTEKEKYYQHHQVFSIAYYVHCAYHNVHNNVRCVICVSLSSQYRLCGRVVRRRT